ncbi:MAG TPA: hypothetical protein PKE45_15690 [Caldilineaceae bacterium]|nr:hypothetical protein [Caldilineaceae bacterium]
MQVGRGAFALWSEVAIGWGHRGLAIALGRTSLATACTQPLFVRPEATAAAPSAVVEPVAYLRVISEFVNSYVLVRATRSPLSIQDCPTMAHNWVS